MRTAIALSLGILTTVAGCTSGTPPPETQLSSPAASVDRLANGRDACLAIQKANNTYGANILTLNDDAVAQRTQQWATATSKAAQAVHDTALRATLLNLADVVRGWGAHAPDKAALRGYQNDFDVACHQLLTTSPPAA